MVYSKTIRQSNMEVLRIIAMFLIVLSHWGGHGNWTITSTGGIFFNKVFLQWIQSIGEIGNCLFILITGYFCITQDKIHFYSLKRIIINVKLYAFFIWVFCVLYNHNLFTYGGAVKALFPIVFNQYWFVFPYLTVYLFSPVINKVINSFDKNTVKIYILFLVFTQMILPMFKCTYFESNIGIFILFYSVGAMIRKGYFSILNKFLIPYLCFFGCIICVFLIITVGNLFAPSEYISIPDVMNFTRRFSIFPLIGALGLFGIMLKHSFSKKYVNEIAKSMFAVYLISENPNIFTWFWKRYFDVMLYYDKKYLFLIGFIDVICVIIVCVIIDVILRKAINKINLIKRNYIS